VKTAKMERVHDGAFDGEANVVAPAGTANLVRERTAAGSRR
jgi:hypothetical protein